MFMYIAIFLVIAIYASLLAFIMFYSFAQAALVMNYKRFHNRASNTITTNKKVIGEFPMVTVQLPIYNEKYVVKRLIETVAAINYPKDKLEIQVLDDSTDETVEIVRRMVK